MFYYIIGFVEALKGSWLSTDPNNDETAELSDPRITSGETEDATMEEANRYIQVMLKRGKK